MMLDDHAIANLSIPAGNALVDSGCTSTLIGDEDLPDLAKALAEASFGILSIKDWNDAPPISFHGIGGIKTLSWDFITSLLSSFRC